ncbi:MAG: VCBS repeat-containing protein [Pirellulales bacterium]
MIRTIHVCPRYRSAALRAVGISLVAALLFLGCGKEAREAPTSAVSLKSDLSAAATATVDSPPADEKATKGSATRLPADGPSGDRVNPGNVKVDSERLSKQALQILKVIGKSLSRGHAPPEEVLAQFVSPEIHCGVLRPQAMMPIFEAPKLVATAARSASPKGTDHVGIREFRDQLAVLMAPFKDTTEIRIFFKVFNVKVNDDDVRTRAFYEATGTTSQGVLQQRGVWHCSWELGADGKSLRLTAVETRDLEEAVSKVDQGLLFSDCTRTVLDGNAALASDVTVGILEWQKRLPASLRTADHGHHGVALGDLNGDGLDDAYFCSPVALPNRLLVQNKDGTATDRAQEAGVDLLDDTRAALIVDLDNDGDQDLIVLTRKHLVFYSNEGFPSFMIRAKLPMDVFRLSMAASDYDLDGDLDIFACGYGDSILSNVTEPTSLKDQVRLARSMPSPAFDANNGAANLMLRNDGGWTFADVTEETGLDVNNRRFSMACGWEDFDDDGDPDLYVANDFGRNNLYVNDNGVFQDLAGSAGVEDTGFGMGVSWGDYNNDGLMDIYVTDMYTAAGNRVALQPEWQDKYIESRGKDRGQEEWDGVRNSIAGNTLYENQGDGTFVDRAQEAGVAMGLWSWGGVFVDFNNDGFRDLFVPNGYMTNERTDDL